MPQDSARSLKGKSIAVTGASGTLGQALLRQLQAQGAKLTALTSREPSSVERDRPPEAVFQTLCWKVGEEAALAPLFETLDILVLNHGVNVYGDRSPAAIEKS